MDVDEKNENNENNEKNKLCNISTIIITESTCKYMLKYVFNGFDVWITHFKIGFIKLYRHIEHYCC